MSSAAEDVRRAAHRALAAGAVTPSVLFEAVEDAICDVAEARGVTPPITPLGELQAARRVLRQIAALRADCPAGWAIGQAEDFFVAFPDHGP